MSRLSLDLSDVLVVVGLAAIVGGVALLSLAAAAVVGGLGLVGIGLGLEQVRKRR